MLHFKFERQAGQTIIEATIALSLVIIVLGAISMVVVTGLNNSIFSRNQTLAIKLSESGVGYIKFLSNNNPSFFSTYTDPTTIYCLNEPITFPIGVGGATGVGCSLINNIFRRTIEFPASNVSCSGRRVIITTFWSSGKCSSSSPYCHKTQVESCFAPPPSGGVSL